MFTSLLQIANFIKARKIKKDKITNVTELQGFGKAAQCFISSIYKVGCNLLPINKYNNSFRNTVMNKFTSKSLKINLGSTSGKPKGKVAEIIKLPPPIPTCLPKKVLEKSKFFGKDKNSMTKANTDSRKSYAQITNPKVSDILKLKKNYPNLLAKKIENIHKIINNIDRIKPQMKITTKGPSCKQVIILMNKANVDNILVSSSIHITNINRAFKNIKSKVMIDYI